MMRAFRKYFKDLARAHKRLFHAPIDWQEASGSDRVALNLVNFRNKLKGKTFRFKREPEHGLYAITEMGSHPHFFANRTRGLGLYSSGAEARGKQLWKSYLLDNLEFDHNDIVIDCGANYADLWISLRDRIASENYITFEPGVQEHKTIQLNAPHGIHYASGLGTNDETKQFFVNEQDADSSLIEPTCYSDVITVETRSLDSVVAERGIERIKLFKLEAEGFEPEILAGAAQSLAIIEYIAIDGGNERGIAQEETFTQQANILFAANFRIVSTNLSMSARCSNAPINKS